MSTILDKITSLWNRRKREIMLALILALIASLSFGLGYLTAKSGKRAPIIIEHRSSD